MPADSTSVFHPIRSRRTFEEAVDQIADAIRAGDLSPGDRLPPERLLAEMLDISRPTVREALTLLANAGVIRVEPGVRGGAFVTTEIVPADLIRERSEMRVGELAAVLEARRLFEPRVAQLAGLHADDEDLAALRRSIELQRAKLDAQDHAAFLQLDARFHLGMAKATHNPTILAMMKLLLKQLEIARDMAPRTPEETAAAIDLHQRTYKAIVGGDAAEIDAVMDEHLAWLEDFWERETGRPRLRRTPDFLLPHDARVSGLDDDGAEPKRRPRRSRKSSAASK